MEARLVKLVVEVRLVSWGWRPGLNSKLGVESRLVSWAWGGGQVGKLGVGWRPG